MNENEPAMPATEDNAPPRTPPLPSSERLAGVAQYRRAESEDDAGADPLRLDANEGPRSSEALRAALAGIELESIRSYPDARSLEIDLSARFDIAPERAVVTAGGDEAIDRICRAVLDPGNLALTHAPGFEMIPRSARLAGAETREVVWMDGPFPTPRFIEAIDESRPGLVCVVSPNNPTGNAATIEDLVSIAVAARRIGAVVMIDLAYVEFAEHDPTSDLLAFDNVLIVRTFSKAWGLAGLRVGYGLGPAGLIERLRAAGGPYPVAGPSLAIARDRLRSGETDMSAAVRCVIDERRRLADLLTEMGAQPLSSQANFVLAIHPAAADLHERLLQRGVVVRVFPGRSLLERALRITCPGNARDFDRLCDALRAVAREIQS